jgi:hypothetical protein
MCFTDILSHFQIKAHLQKEKLPFSEQELLPIVDHVRKMEKEVKLLQRNSESFWLKMFMRQQGKIHYRYPTFPTVILILECRGVVLLVRDYDEYSLIDTYLVDVGIKTIARYFVLANTIEISKMVRISSPIPPELKVGATIILKLQNADAFKLEWTVEGIESGPLFLKNESA